MFIGTSTAGQTFRSSNHEVSTLLLKFQDIHSHRDPHAGEYDNRQ